MKKIVAISILAMFLFNWFGYRMLISLLESRADQQLEAQLDSDKYDESQLISVKVPVTYLPYYNNSTTFQRVNGKVEIRGVQYNYVKRRVYNDSLEMLCIPNHQAMSLQRSKNDFFKFINDLQQGKKAGSRNTSSKIFAIDSYTLHDLPQCNEPCFILTGRLFHYAARLSFIYLLTFEHPPRHC